jgi:hypothetical protein
LINKKKKTGELRERRTNDHVKGVDEARFIGVVVLAFVNDGSVDEDERS